MARKLAQKNYSTLTVEEGAFEKLIWSDKNVIIIDNNSCNDLNSWIPIRWLPLDNNLYEEERRESAQHQLEYRKPPHWTRKEHTLFKLRLLWIRSTSLYHWKARYSTVKNYILKSKITEEEDGE